MDSIRARLRVAARSIAGIGAITADFIDLARQSVGAVLKLRNRTRSISVGDMVVVRMGRTSRNTDSIVGTTGIVLFKSANPVWSKYNILINGERICLTVDEIEKHAGG